jgi:hypothetical protein
MEANRTFTHQTKAPAITSNQSFTAHAAALGVIGGTAYKAYYGDYRMALAILLVGGLGIKLSGLDVVLTKSHGSNEDIFARIGL